MPRTDPTHEPDPREVKLPVWVQDELNHLRRDLADARADRDRARLDTDPDGSNTIIARYDAIPIGLGDSPRVRFFVGANRDRDYIDVHVDEHDASRITVQSAGFDWMSVRPQSGNVVTIGMEKR
jgi:hypothetical protein